MKLLDYKMPTFSPYDYIKRLNQIYRLTLV